jgi:hypothetical protein
MATHKIKCWIEPFNEVISGKKKFEYRLNDRNYAVGDYLYLQEWNPKSKSYTGRSVKKYVTSILTSGFGLPEGYCIMSLSEGWLL